MTEINYGVVTVADCEPEYRETAFGLMTDFAEQLKSEAGAEIVRYGYFGTGSNAGALVFTQLYRDLSGFDKAQEVYAGSSSYQSLISSGQVSVILRNIVKMIPVEFNKYTTDTPKYMVFTKAVINPEDKVSVISDMAHLSGLFSENGAATLRFGQLITGSNVGQYLLAVTYPAMENIEKAYDALNDDATYKSLASKVNINRREIVRLVS